MRSLTKMLLRGLAALTVLSGAQAGPIRNAVSAWQEARQERREARCGGCGQPVQQQQQAAPAPTVVTTSYSGVGVPVDATPYTPIQVGQPLPTSCGPGGCGQGVRFGVGVGPVQMWGGFGGGYCPTCSGGRR